MEQPPPSKRPRVESLPRNAQKDEEMEESHCRVEWPAVPMQFKYQGGAFFYERECYDEYYTLINSLVLAPTEVVVVTGTPGTLSLANPHMCLQRLTHPSLMDFDLQESASRCYGYFFDRFRREHPQVCVIAAAFSTRKPRDVLVYKGDGSGPVFHEYRSALVATAIIEASAIEAFDAHRHVVYLCDGPPDEYRPSSCVVFSSPNDTLLRETRKYQETYYMPLWTREELYEAAAVLDLPIRRLQQPSEMDSELDDVATREREREAEIDRRFDIFGGAARYCLHPDPAKVALAVDDLEEAIKTIRDVNELQTLLEGKTVENVRHRMLYFKPRQDNRARKTTDLASSHVMEKLADKMLASYLADRERFRDMLRGFSDAASLCGLIFERETHKKLIEGCTLALRRLTPVAAADPGLELEVVIMPTNKPIVKFRTVAKAMLERGPYHQPESRVWESIDSFYFPTMTTAAPDTQDVVAWNTQPANRLLLFQITISETHEVNVVGIVHVLAKLDLLESVARHPERAALVFVVPKDIVRDFKRQKIVVPTHLGSNLITAIDGIADKTAAVLGQYEIRTVDELQAKIISFDEGAFSVKPEHIASWTRARRAGIKHGLVFDGTRFGDTIAGIPQYVCSWEDGV